MTGQKRDERDEEPRPRVRVTDKRRVQAEAPEGSVTADAPAGSEAPAGSDAELKVQEYKEHLQRLAADFDNYRKRVLKEQTRAVETASEPLIRRLLEVLDEFELALLAAEQRPDTEKVLHGVELVYAKLLDILRAEGLERIDAQGKPFDPAYHEALLQTGDSAGEPIVADVIRPGYTFKGSVVRPSDVKVISR